MVPTLASSVVLVIHTSLTFELHGRRQVLHNEDLYVQLYHTALVENLARFGKQPRASGSYVTWDELQAQVILY